MDSVIGIIIAITLSALVGVGYYTYEDSQVDHATDKILALNEARSIVNFTNAFNAYVQKHQKTITGQGSGSNINPTVLTATTISLPASEGVDALGETLEGLVSTPYGSSLSWIVAPVTGGTVSYSTPSGGTATATTAEMMQKYGINTPLQAEQFWGEVSADIVQLSSGAINGYVYNNVGQSFVPNLAGSLIQSGATSPTYSATSSNNNGVWDSLPNYFPSSGVPYPQQAPQIYAPYQFSIIASSALSKSPGYWVWAMNLYNNWGSGTPKVFMQFYSVGYSPGCPAGGLTPQVYNGAGNAQMDSLNSDTADGQNYLSNYICLPISLPAYTQIAPTFNYSNGACITDSIDCSAYDDLAGDQIGYSASCSGSSCQNENLMDGEGYNPGNDGAHQGEGTSANYWENTADWNFPNDVDYLYGTYLINMPGGFQYSLFWSSGVNLALGQEWVYFGNKIGLFSGNVVNQPVYTDWSINGYNAHSWTFTIDGDPTDVSSSSNQNFTVLNLN